MHDSGLWLRVQGSEYRIQDRGLRISDVWFGYRI